MEARSRSVYSVHGDRRSPTALRERRIAHGDELGSVSSGSQAFKQQQRLILSTAPVLAQIDMQRIQWLENTARAATRATEVPADSSVNIVKYADGILYCGHRIVTPDG